jgi:glutaredoxin
MKSAAPNTTTNKILIWVGALFIHNFWFCLQGLSMSKPNVIIYSRPGCHLCDEAKTAILSAGCGDQFTLEEVNIESDEELLRKYQYDIPVILIDGVESFIHRVDPTEFKTRIKRIKNPN